MKTGKHSKDSEKNPGNCDEFQIVLLDNLSKTYPILGIPDEKFYDK